MGERNERQDRRQRGQQNRAGALYCRLHHRVERIEPCLFVMVDLANQDQRIAHQDPRQGDQAHKSIDAKRLIEQQQCRHHANQPQRRGQENHDHRRQRTHLQDNDQQREGDHDGK